MSTNPHRNGASAALGEASPPSLSAYLAALADGAPPYREPSDFTPSEAEVVEAAHMALAAGGLAELGRALQVLAVRWPAVAAVLPVDPSPRQAPDLYPTGDAPPLPHAARVNAPPLAPDNFLARYVAHAQTVSPMTPRLFHESSALWLLSVAVARRLYIDVGFGRVYPNLFILWAAPTTLHRKTTALELGRTMARAAFGHLLAAQDTTPEAFLSDLAGQEPANYDRMTSEQKDRWLLGRNFAAQRGWLLDEFSSLLAGAGKDYNAGLIEAMLRFFDGTPYTRSTKGQGWIEIEHPYLSLLGASTPAALGQHMLVERLWSDGFWPRFALLTPEQERPEWGEPTDTPDPAELVKVLAGIYTRLPRPAWPAPPEARAVTIDRAEALAMWNRYNKACSYDLLTVDVDSRLWGSYGRLPTHALKLATLLAVLDWAATPAPHIEARHMAQAVAICETWRVSAHRALELASQTGYDARRRRVLRQLARHEPAGASLRDLCQAMRDQKPDDVADVLRQLVAAGDVDELPAEPGPKGGRPTARYRLAH